MELIQSKQFEQKSGTHPALDSISFFCFDILFGPSSRAFN